MRLCLNAIWMLVAEPELLFFLSAIVLMASAGLYASFVLGFLLTLYAVRPLLARTELTGLSPVHLLMMAFYVGGAVGVFALVFLGAGAIRLFRECLFMKLKGDSRPAGSGILGLCRETFAWGKVAALEGLRAGYGLLHDVLSRLLPLPLGPAPAEWDRSALFRRDPAGRLIAGMAEEPRKKVQEGMASFNRRVKHWESRVNLTYHATSIPALLIFGRRILHGLYGFESLVLGKSYMGWFHRLVNWLQSDPICAVLFLVALWVVGWVLVLTLLAQVEETLRMASALWLVSDQEDMNTEVLRKYFPREELGV